MIEIHLRYENDRGTPAPERIYEEGDNKSEPPGHGRFWWIELKGEVTKSIVEWLSALPKRMTAKEVEDAMVDDLAVKIGVKNTMDLAEWNAKGVDIINHTPKGGFDNWPDLDLGRYS